jgi:peptide/nickel transport system permease protein
MSTRAIQFLKKKKIAFEVVKYEHEEKGAAYAAKSTGYPLAQTVKTLVVDLGEKGYTLVLMPGDRQLSMKRLAFVLSIPLGIISALRPGGISDRSTVFVSLIGLSVPQFWLGLLLIVVFAVQLHWLPTSGVATPAHIILPAITMALPALARMVMIVRSSMIDELNQQYVKTGFAKGLPFYRVVGMHALRNAALPVVTLCGWELIRAVAGYSVVVETVFAWPGLGMTAIQAIEREDLILLQAIVFTVAITVVLINIMMDRITG